MRRRRVPGLFRPIGPQRWLRRRRWATALLIVTIAGLAAYDHYRRPPTPPAPAGLQDDMGRYDGQTFRVAHTVDGDTIHLDVSDKGKARTVVRLWGVDTPEVHGVKQPAYFGPQASKFTRSQTTGKQVRVELVPGRTRDRYGRLLAYIHLPDGTMLNERLVAEGYAYADTQYSHRLRARFVRLEEKARQGKAGLWAGVTVPDMPPWRQKREKQPAEAEPGAMGPMGTDRPGIAAGCGTFIRAAA